MTDYRRLAVRCFVVLIVFDIVVETMPRDWPLAKQLKQMVGPLSSRLGLAQGEWALFAPNPVIKNGWVSAEVYYARDLAKSSAARPVKTWNSPIWRSVGPWEKFYRFRTLNYFNRMPPTHMRKIEDFGDYLVRQLVGEHLRPVPIDLLTKRKREAEQSGGSELTEDSDEVVLKLFSNHLQIVMPEDGTLPPPEEIIWLSVGENLLLRTYAP